MTENPEPPNLANHSNSSVGQKILSLERISSKFSSFKKKGSKLLESMKEQFETGSDEGLKNVGEEKTEVETQKSTFSSVKEKDSELLDSVNEKFDEESSVAKKHVGDEEINVAPQRSTFSIIRPKRCLCPVSKPKWRSKISEIGSITLKAFGKSREPSIVSQPKIPKNQGQLEKTTRSSENEAASGEEEFSFLKYPEQESDKSRRFSNYSTILSVNNQPNNEATDDLDVNLKRQQSLEELRKSSIKSPRTSLPVAIEPMEPIEEIETVLSSIKIEQATKPIIEAENPIEKPKESTFEENLEKIEQVPKISVIEEVIENEEPIQFEVVNVSRRDYEKMERNSHDRKIIRINHKTLPPDAKDLSVLPAGEKDPHAEWKDVPAPVIDEIRRLTKPKRPHKCPKTCPCKFSQELIHIYHEAKTLSEKADKINESKDHCKFRMTKSEINFFKEDTKMCNVMIAETQSRRAEMRELMDMWQEANEKFTARKKEIISIVESIESATKRIEDVENVLRDWLPGGRMEQLRKMQRDMEKKDLARMEMLEDEERTLSQERIEQILKKREIWQANENLREEKCKEQRAQDMLKLENATSLMQKYIDERKSLIR